MRRRDRSGSSNLDSLLDTMTNVVGILVIVLAVTQLNVAQAIKRAEDQADDADADAVGQAAAGAVMTPEAEAEAQRRLDQLQLSLEKLRAQWGVLEAVAPKDLVDLGKLRRLMADLRRQVSDPIHALPNLEDLDARRDAMRRDRKALDDRIKQALARIEALKRRLQQAPKRPPAKVVRLPFPKDAPKGAKATYFVCRSGRIYPFGGEALFDLFMDEVRKAVGQRDGDVQATAANVRKIVAHFAKNDIGDAMSRIHIRAGEPGIIRTFMRRRPGQGETLKEMLAPGSAYRRAVGRVDAASHWVRFLVWSDSFELYLAARQIAEQRRVGGRPAPLLVGWTAFGLKELYSHRLGAGGGDGPSDRPD